MIKKLDITKEDLLLLEKNNYSFNYTDDDIHITFFDKDGNQVQGLSLVSIVVKDILQELKEEDTVYLSDEEVLERFDYDILCESPLEILSPDGEFATGGFAKLVISHLRNKLN
tara:strand:+ start:707 stop:1045 length:339 start_codon:yes stop_codon:yes gene_type:complete